jgi:hypothetical protein
MQLLNEFSADKVRITSALEKVARGFKKICEEEVQNKFAEK